MTQDTIRVGVIGVGRAMQDGTPIDLPDFSHEENRKAFEHDHWSPWPGDAGPGQPPPSILGTPEPTPAGMDLAKEVWDGIGYTGEDQ